VWNGFLIYNMIMTGVSIVMDTKETFKSLSLLAKSQYPFALAKSLTMTAKIAQERVKRVTEAKFNVRSKFTTRGIRIIPSRKADVQRGIANAAVFTDSKITNYMVGHEAGQTRRASTSKFMSVPSTDLKKKGFRMASGRVKKKFRPSVLLKGKATNRSGANQKRRSRQRKAFIIQGKDGTPLIVRRQNLRASRPLELLYVLKKNVKIDKKWTFEKQVRVSVGFNFERTFSREMNRAIATAR